MSDTVMQVKFNWKKTREPDSKDDQQKDANNNSVKSRTARYMDSVKTTDPAKYKHLKEIDSERKRIQYVNINERSKEHKIKQRQQWKAAKQKERSKVSINAKESQHVQEKGTRWKDMSAEEKKEYYKMKMRISRRMRSNQKKSAEKKNDKERKRKRQENTCTNTSSTHDEARTSSSRATHYRHMKNVCAEMPQSPTSYARVVETLVIGDIATPNKREKMEECGTIARRNLEAEMLASNIKAHVSHLGKSRRVKDRQALHTLLKASTSSPEPSAISTSDQRETGNLQTSSPSTMIKDKARYPLRAKSTRKYLTRKYLGASRRSWARVRRDTSTSILTKSKKNRCGISEKVVDMVREFWWSPAVSRPLPLKKRVKHGVPTHLLECSYSTAYMRFKDANPSAKIGYVKFIQLRPKLRENVKLKLTAINQLSISKHSTKLSNDEQTLSAMTLCQPDGTAKYAAKACIDRICNECGVKNISRQLQTFLETDGESLIEFKEWKRVEKTTVKDGKATTRKIMEQVKKEVKLEDLVKSLETEMEKFSSHLFRAKWQQEQLAKAKEIMKAKSAITIMDYAENYTCTAQDEIQSAHWVTQAVTIHPIMTYINASEQPGSRTNIESMIFISSDLKHNADGLEHFRTIAYRYLQRKYGICHVEEFSDCSASQYRCSKSFADISFANDISITHNYFEASHGKSAADGLGAVTKHAAAMAVTRRQYAINSAREFYEFCVAELSEVGKNIYPSQAQKYDNSSRSFFLCENINRNREDREVCTVKGTMKVHCVAGDGEPYKIKVRDVTCTCQYCWNGTGDRCSEEDYVGSWQNITLERKVDDHPENPVSCMVDRCPVSPTVDELVLSTPDECPISPLVNRCPASPTVDELMSPTLDERPASPTVDELMSPTLDERPASSSVDECPVSHSPVEMSSTVGDGTCNVTRASIDSHNQEQLDFAMSLSNFERKLDSKGWKAKDFIPADGNCFFWAVSSQLDLHFSDKTMTHSELRGRTVSYMRQLPEAEKTTLSNYLPENDFNKYVNSLQQNSVYADHVAIKLLCDMLNCQVHIVSSSDEPDVEIGPTSPRVILNLGYLTDHRHYISLDTTPATRRLHRLRPSAGDFVAVRLLTSQSKKAKKFYIYPARVTKVDHNGLHLRFLKQTSRNGVYAWPDKCDSGIHPEEDILRILSSPCLLPDRGILLQFDNNELEQCEKMI